MNQAVIDAIKECKELAQEAVQRVNEYADNIHANSKNEIGDNAGGLDELGQMVSDLAESIDDLGSTISALDERITALEKGAKS